MAVYGVDLGTTYSCIASIDDVGRPTVLRNLEGTDTTPSVVFFENAENVIVGATAKDNAALEPDHVVSLIKRDMGRDVSRHIHGFDYTPAELSAFILLKLATDAHTTTGQYARDVVITVPAYFGAAERDATRKAGQIAGLNVIDIISEPIAAAITYGVLNPDQDRTILVYDLGGGTFDTTVITLRGGHIEVICTDGDHELGGADWDARLVEYLAEQFKKEHSDASDPLDDKQTEQQLRRDAEDTKKALTSRTTHTVRVMHDGRVAAVEVTRERFEELTKDLLDRTIELTGRTLATAADKGVTDYDELLLVVVGHALVGGGRGRTPGELDGPVEQVLGELLEPLPRHLDRRHPPVVHDPYGVRGAGGERLLCVLGVAAQLLFGLLVVQRVARVRVLLFELLGEVLHQAGVPVRAAELVVAVGADDLEVPAAQRDDRGVERAAAQVVHEDGAVLVGVEHAIGDGRGDRLGDDVDDVEPGDLARLAGRVAFGRAEVGRHRDDDVAGVLPGRGVRVGRQLEQDERGQLRGRVVEPVDVPRDVPAHVPLDQADHVVRLERRVVLRGRAPDDVLGVLEEDD